MKKRMNLAWVILGVPVMTSLVSLGSSSMRQEEEAVVSYKTEVAPIIKKYCLPCHAEESYNPSKLALDSHALLMKGGEHGASVVPGKPGESVLMQKLREEPPFGDRMPLKSRRAKKTDAPKKLSEVETQLLSKWIAQGAKDN